MGITGWQSISEQCVPSEKCGKMWCGEFIGVGTLDSEVTCGASKWLSDIAPSGKTTAIILVTCFVGCFISL